MGEEAKKVIWEQIDLLDQEAREANARGASFRVQAAEQFVRRDALRVAREALRQVLTEVG